MKNSLLITENRVYAGSTNEQGQPEGEGFLVDFKMNALFEGWFKSAENFYGCLRVIRSKGEMAITE